MGLHIIFKISIVLANGTSKTMVNYVNIDNDLLGKYVFIIYLINYFKV